MEHRLPAMSDGQVGRLVRVPVEAVAWITSAACDMNVGTSVMWADAIGHVEDARGVSVIAAGTVHTRPGLPIGNSDEGVPI